MPEAIIEERNGGFLISNDKEKLDIETIFNYLSKESYWSKHIPMRIVKKSIENSMCFGIYDTTNKNRQIGFARVMGDQATYAYLADVFILTEYRGKGLSKWLMKFILAHPDLQGLRKFGLATLDAHGLYEQFGFKPLDKPERQMEIRNNSVYWEGKE